MENVRSHGYWGNGQVRIVHEPHDLKPGENAETVYLPDFPEWARKKARTAGHGGGDFFTNHFFAEAIRTGKPHFSTCTARQHVGRRYPVVAQRA